MTKASKAISAGRIVDYHREHFAKADQATYYTEGGKIVGQFHGRLAEEFGLLGKPATEEIIQRLADGQHPWTGEQLVKHRTSDPMPPWQKTQSAWSKHVEDVIVEGIESSRWSDRVPYDAASPGRGRPKGPERIHEPARALPIPEYDSHQLKLIEIHEEAARFYSQRLALDQRGKDYVAYRGIADETVAEFRLGFAGTGNELADHLKAKYAPNLLEASGLVYRRQADGQLVDRFRDRLMIPLQDEAGNVVAFAGRRVDKNKDRKYINSPSTAIYRKSEALFNAHRAAKEEAGRLVIVEGPLDAIQAHQAGVRKIVALSGTSLPAERIRETSGHVLLNLDGDEAGKCATERHMQSLMKEGVDVRALSLEGDADKYIVTNGAKAYSARVENSKPLIAWLGERSAEKFGDADGAWSRADGCRWIREQLHHVPEDQRPLIEKELRIHLGLADQAKTGKDYSEHRAAIDVMFAPPKSVSVQALVGGDERIIDAHRRAVKVALDRLEGFVQARHRDSRETSANWVAALFVHDVSRPVGGGAPDPQVHTHAVVFNMTRSDEEHAVRSMDPEWIYRAQTFANAIYMSEMANDLRGFGYQLERAKGFAFEIAGYTPEYLLAVSKRAEQIEKEKERQGVVGAEAGERIALQLRENKQSWDPELLRAEHLREVAEYAIDPLEIGMAARERIVRSLPADVGKTVADEAIDYAKSRLYDRQAINERFEVIRDALRYSPHLLRVADIEAALEARQSEFIATEHYRREAPGERYTTPEMKAMEIESINTVLRGQGVTTPIVDAGEVSKKEFLARFGIREIKGKRLEITRDQLRIAYAGLTSRNQYLIVAGAAGVGKSSSFEIVAEMAEEHREAGYRVQGMAATSSATNNLRDMGIEAGTLQLHNTRGVKAGTPKTLYLLDEGSLVGTKSFRKFVDSVRPQDRVIIAYDYRQHHSVEAGRIIEELEMAGVETIRMEKIMRQQNNPELLANIEKFRDSFGPHGNPNMIEGLRALAERFRVWEVPSRKKRFEAIAEFYAIDPERSLAISPDNKSLMEINLAIRERLQKDGIVGPDVYAAVVLKGVRDMTDADKCLAVNYRPGDVIRWGRAGTLGGHGRVGSGQYTTVTAINADRNEVSIMLKDSFGEREISFDPRTGQGEVYEAEPRTFAVGDKVQITRPWTLSRGDVIANRAIGVIRELDETGKGFLEIEGRRIALDIAMMQHLEWGYAMTSYSAQSATVPRVAVHIDTGDTMIRSLIEKPLLYVGASRAAEDVAIFTDNRELLLDPQRSPILRQHDKPMALSREEIEQEIQSIGIAS